MTVDPVELRTVFAIVSLTILVGVAMTENMNGRVLITYGILISALGGLEIADLADLLPGSRR